MSSKPSHCALGREAEHAGCRQRDARQHSSGERGDTEEFGGLLGRGETPAGALLWHGGSLRGRERAASFAGQADRSWPRLYLTVTAVQPRIKPLARLLPSRMGADLCRYMPPYAS